MPEAEWQPLFNGHDLSNWRHFIAKPDKSFDVPGLKRDELGNYLEPIGYMSDDPLNIFSVVKLEGEPVIRISGQVIANLFTDQSYQNYHLKLKFKWGDIKWGWMKGRPRDGGVLYHYNRSEAGFSYRHEYQIHEGDVGSWWAKHIRVSIPSEWTTEIPPSIQQAKPFLVDLAPTLSDTMLIYKSGEQKYRFPGRPEWQICIAHPYNENPAGEWNSLEIICYKNHAIHIINGTFCLALLNSTVLIDDVDHPVNSGSIQLQSEGAEIFFKDIFIKTIDSIPTEFVQYLK
jgi:hypothetical protein